MLFSLEKKKQKTKILFVRERDNQILVNKGVEIKIMENIDTAPRRSPTQSSNCNASHVDELQN